MKLVYIAGPYRAATPEGIEANVRQAAAYGAKVAAAGFVPLVPHAIGFLVDREARDWRRDPRVGDTWRNAAGETRTVQVIPEWERHGIKVTERLWIGLGLGPAWISAEWQPVPNSIDDMPRCSDDYWLAATAEMLRRCDALLAIPGWERSSGTKAEIETAREEGIPVVYVDGDVGVFIAALTDVLDALDRRVIAILPREVQP